MSILTRRLSPQDNRGVKSNERTQPASTCRQCYHGIALDSAAKDL